VKTTAGSVIYRKRKLVKRAIMVNKMDPEVKHMAQPKMIEGTGEELQDYLRQAPLDRYRLIRISEVHLASNGDGPNKQSLAEALQDYIGLASFGETNLSEDTGKKFAKLLVEKHRMEQL
jgi:hypothetical protein